MKEKNEKKKRFLVGIGKGFLKIFLEISQVLLQYKQ